MHPTNIIFQASLEVNKMISDRADDSCSRSSGGDHVVGGGLENTSEKRGGSVLEGVLPENNNIQLNCPRPPQGINNVLSLSAQFCKIDFGYL